MNFKSLKSSIAVAAVTFFMSTQVNAEVIYEESFDGELGAVEFWPITGLPNYDADWLTIYRNIGTSPTIAYRGEGKLVIQTEDKNSGVITHLSSDYNFFDRELTFTLEGVQIEALGKSRVPSQWARFGIVSRVTATSWDARSSIIISYNGAGTFRFGVKQRNINYGYDSAPRKNFISRTFNFDVTYLRKIELTMDSVNYRVAFVFENEMDQLTFGGPHLLDRNRWIEDPVVIGIGKAALNIATESLAVAQSAYDEAVSGGDPSTINSAKDVLDAQQIEYDTRLAYFLTQEAELEEITGRSALLIVASSDALYTRAFSAPDEILEDEDGNLGARLSVGLVKVETTSRLEGL